MMGEEWTRVRDVGKVFFTFAAACGVMILAALACDASKYNGHSTYTTEGWEMHITCIDGVEYMWRDSGYLSAHFKQDGSLHLCVSAPIEPVRTGRVIDTNPVDEPSVDAVWDDRPNDWEIKE